MRGCSMSSRPFALCLLCGLPAAGKSTLARALNRGAAWECARLSFDDVIPKEAFRHLTSSEFHPKMREELARPEGAWPHQEAEPVMQREETAWQEGAEPLHLQGAEHLKDGSDEALQVQGVDGWLSPWKQYRQELLLYIDHLLMAVATCSPLSVPEDHTEALWKSFLCCLERQGFIYSEASETGSSHVLQNPTASAPLCIVMDDNFYYQSMRYEVYQLARKHSAGFCQLFLDCPMEICLQRNRQRRSPLPDEIIQLMAGKIEKPNPCRNPWEQNSLILDVSGSTWDNPRVTSLLQHALKNPVKQLPENAEQKDADRAISASNFLHQADQAFRRIISQSMQMAKGKVPASEKKALAEEFHNLKGELLEELRQGRLAGPCSPLQLGDPLINIIIIFQGHVDNILLRHTTK